MLSLSSSLLPRVCLARALLCFSLLPRVCLVCKLVFLQQSASFSAALLSLLPDPPLALEWLPAAPAFFSRKMAGAVPLPRCFLLGRNPHRVFQGPSFWQGIFICLAPFGKGCSFSPAGGVPKQAG